MAIATWTDEQGMDDIPYLPVVTLPAAQSWRCVITCDELYLPYTHWLSGRTLPCLGAECGACGAKKPKRPEAFASVATLHNRRHQILRLTREVASTILRHPLAAQSVRGICLELRRRGSKPNGHVAAILEEIPYEGSRLPASQVVALHLFRVWRTDGWEPTVDYGDYVAALEREQHRLAQEWRDGRDRNAS